ncbi:MAG: PKD domain-containing protein [Candidatus Bathyarchaeia archaeon]
MNKLTTKTACLIIIAMLSLSALASLPAFSGFPPRFFDRPGKGTATFYVTPQDSIFEVPPTTNGTWFTVYVRIANATFCAGWQVELFYNKQYLYTSPDKVTYASDMPFPVSPVTPTVDSYNATYNYVLHCGISNPFQEYTISDAGLVKIDFQIIAIPPPTATYASLLYFGVGTESAFGSWTEDYNLDENDLLVYDGYYEIHSKGMFLSISPTVTNVIGKQGTEFSVDILISGVSSADELFLVQFALYYNKTLLTGVWIDEGTFMNNPAWAPHGTLDNSTIIEDGKMLYWVMIAPNGTGYWDNTEWPSGGGLLATARFKVAVDCPDPDNLPPEELNVTTALTLEGVFGEFFIGHPNLPDPEYLPYDPPINGRVDIYNYCWKYPEASFTWTPEFPMFGQVVTFDASSSFGYGYVGITLVPDIAFIKEFTWNFGDGTPPVTETDPITDHVYAEGGEYFVTLTVKDVDNRIDTESKKISIVMGRVIDVYTQYSRPYGGQGINQTSDMFWPQKPVILTAELTYNGDPVQHKPVAFQIVSPTGFWNFTRVAFTDSNGIATMGFGLPWPCEGAEDLVFGVWTVIAKADIQCVTTEDWLWFKVYWFTHNLTVTAKESYTKGDYATFDVTFVSCRRQPEAVLVTLTVYDDLNVPIANASKWIMVGDPALQWCTFKEYNTSFTVYIPKWAFVGTGKVYVNTFFKWPMDCGYALSPEASDTFMIVKA